MTSAIIAFAAGIAWLQWQPVLPDNDLLAVLTLVAGLLVVLPVVLPRLRLMLPIGAFLFGIVWATSFAAHRLADQLPLASEGRDIDLVGVVTEMPQQTDRGVRFRFAVETSSLPVPQTISLSWYSRWTVDDDVPEAVPVTVHAGERWHFRVRLKRPHGSLNPDGFDFEGWLFERGIRATGYVRAAPEGKPATTFVPGFTTAVERLRETVRGRYLSILGDRPYAGILVALSVGDQQAIAPGLWQGFSRTGLTHLMSI